jgi:methylmalonyl-CoA mutase cobalamin-binding subunit
MATLSEEHGIGRLFGPGSTTEDAVEYVRSWYEENRADDAA